MKLYASRLLYSISLVFIFALVGCASSDEDAVKAAAEQLQKDRVEQQRNRAQEADYDLQKTNQ